MRATRGFRKALGAVIILVGLLAGCGGGVGGGVVFGDGPYYSPWYGPVVVAPTLIGVAVVPANSSLAAGQQLQLILLATYSDGSSATVTDQAWWTSSVPAVAVVSNVPGQNGVATALSGGTTVITAVSGGFSASATLNVTGPAVQSLTVLPASPTIAAGTAVQMSVVATYANGAMADVTPLVTWTSSQPATASVSNTVGSQGRVVGITAGQATVTAALGGVASSTVVTVTSATLQTLTITPATATIARGTTAGFSATGTFSDGTTQNLDASVAWSSSNLQVATISSTQGAYGLATGTGAGTSTISAQLMGVSATATLTVTNANVVGLTITPPSATVLPGGTTAFRAQATFDDATTQDVTAAATWTTSVPAVATVSNTPGSQGVVSGVSPGSTSVSATLSNVVGSATATVTSP